MLQDILAHELTVIFCGTAAGNVSAERGHYYSGPGNKFWKTLHDIGLTPHRLPPEEDKALLSYGIGLTDLVKDVSGMDKDIPQSAFALNKLEETITKWRPQSVAFNGKKAAQEALNVKNIDYGLALSPELHHVNVWVLPSTSGAANGFWDIKPWLDMAKSFKVVPTI